MTSSGEGAECTLSDHTGIAPSVLVAPDGNPLATTGEDGTVRLWDTDACNNFATLTAEACTIAVRPLSEKEGQRYVSEGVGYQRIRP
ncbi:WD40 repeat domain-containing protein [Streptomyces chrestomyceticus]|uniref:WD40 repeat domain-containing protein n=1 Tax=Streptomyces chrestomyceticus TaxID=68185 RepID=UPI0004C93CB6